MGRFGPGTALVLASACGAAGFGVAALVRDPSAASVGASGVIMGALGLLSAGSLRNWRHLPAPLRRRQVALDWIRGGMLFVLLGLSPDSDLVAHTGGFLTGLLAGTLACLSPLETTHPRRENALLATWFLSIAAAWAHALRP
jgi:membrane associated rhomboid family serine protease